MKDRIVKAVCCLLVPGSTRGEIHIAVWKVYEACRIISGKDLLDMDDLAEIEEEVYENNV